MWVYSGDGACYVFRYNGVTIPGLVPFNIQAPITQSRLPQTAPEGVKLKRLWSMYAKKSTYTTNTSNSFSPTGELITAMSTPTNINASIPGEIVNFICKKEAGKSYGYQMAPKDLNGYNLGDAGGHRTFGYGLLFHPTLNRSNSRGPSPNWSLYIYNISIWLPVKYDHGLVRQGSTSLLIRSVPSSVPCSTVVLASSSLLRLMPY